MPGPIDNVNRTGKAIAFIGFARTCSMIQDLIAWDLSEDVND